MTLAIGEFLPLLKLELENAQMEERFDEIENYLNLALPDNPTITTWFIDNDVSLDTWYSHSHLNEKAIQLLIVERKEHLFEFLFSEHLSRYDVVRIGDAFLVEEYTKSSESGTMTEFLYSHSVGGSPNQTIIRKNDNNVQNNYEIITSLLRTLLLKR